MYTLINHADENLKKKKIVQIHAAIQNIGIATAYTLGFVVDFQRLFTVQWSIDKELQTFYEKPIEYAH
jgi:hypothetical protein